jgi:P pilus assembly chaperone PapD
MVRPFFLSRNPKSPQPKKPYFCFDSSLKPFPMKKTCFLITAFALLLAWQPVRAQVAIAPSTVFISDATNVGTLYVSNRSDEPQEVNIEFAFGYPSSDQDGNLVMNYQDSAAFELYALNDWIRAFPRSFILGPRQQQTVRFQVRPRPNIPDGVYWTRVKVLANPQTAEVDVAAEEGITTRITFRFEQVIAAFYRKGNTTTGLHITQIDARQQDQTLILLPHLQRTGNAPFVGSMIAKLYNQDGEMVKERQSTTTAYFEEVRRIEIDVNDLPAGQYRAEITFETRRADMSPTDLVQAPTVTESVNIQINK